MRLPRARCRGLTLSAVLATVVIVALPASAFAADGLAEVLPIANGGDPHQAAVRIRTATGNVASDVRLAVGGDAVVVNDLTGATVLAGAGCRQLPADDPPTKHRVVCELAAGSGRTWHHIAIDLGAGDDTLTAYGSHTGEATVIDIDGGPGDDVLDGFNYSSEDDQSIPASKRPAVLLHGGPGDDRLALEGSHDTAYGEAGKDRLLMSANRHDPLVATHGRLFGGAGNDDLAGGTGNGPVTAFGGDGDDTIHGTKWADLIAGGKGHDHVFAGAGDDTIFLRDGVRDVANCGGGQDHVVADAASIDNLLLLCELVSVA
jgi:Ca2+-binding RTX toxin-like protein